MATRPTRPRQTPLAEWISATIGALLIVATLSALIYEAIVSPDLPPEFQTDVIAVSPTNSGYRVTFRIRNLGTRTAAAVHVRGEISVAGATADAAETVVDYVGAESSASGALLFVRDPRLGELSVRAVGYQDP
jgi:uncharacterized protein (TIGR02588 family)